MPEPKKNLSGLAISREVVVGKEKGESERKVLDPSSVRNLSDGIDPSIVLDLVTEIQRRKILD